MLNTPCDQAIRRVALAQYGAFSSRQVHEQGGSWDRWTVANDYTGVMNGDPYHIIVSSAYAFGARDFDAQKALLLMIKGATQPTQGYTERPGNEDYQKLGYVPGEGADTLLGKLPGLRDELDEAPEHVVDHALEDGPFVGIERPEG